MKLEDDKVLKWVDEQEKELLTRYKNENLDFVRDSKVGLKRSEIQEVEEEECGALKWPNATIHGELKGGCKVVKGGVGGIFSNLREGGT